MGGGERKRGEEGEVVIFRSLTFVDLFSFIEKHTSLSGIILGYIARLGHCMVFGIWRAGLAYTPTANYVALVRMEGFLRESSYRRSLSYKIA